MFVTSLHCVYASLLLFYHTHFISFTLFFILSVHLCKLLPLPTLLPPPPPLSQPLPLPQAYVICLFYVCVDFLAHVLQRHTLFIIHIVCFPEHHITTSFALLLEAHTLM